MSDNIESSSYFHRVISLVIDVGTQTLRDKFYSIVPKAYVQTYFSETRIKSEFKKLKAKKRLTNVQFDKVTDSPDPDSYDISLLITLLSNQQVCRIPAPLNGWAHIPPDPNDHTVGADLLRLRDVRNEIIGHPANAQLNEADFQRLWVDIETVLLRIAGSINVMEEAKIKEMVQDARIRMLEPLHDREKKLLQWHKEDTEKYQEQLTEVQNSLDMLHIKVNNIPCSTDETDASRSDDAFSSLQSQVSNLVQNFSSIARQDCVIQEKLNGMHVEVQNICQTQQMMKKQYDDIKLCLETMSNQTQYTVNPVTSLLYRRNADWAQARPTDAKPKTKVSNTNAMSEKLILNISNQIGRDWYALRIHLDFTEAQSDALKVAHGNSLQQCTHVMLKAWHDVVVECGENPPMLLAAAFVNSSKNYSMADQLVPRDQLNENASAKPTTVERIESIMFCKDGHYVAQGGNSMDQGDDDGNVVPSAGSSMTFGPLGHTYPTQGYNPPTVRGDVPVVSDTAMMSDNPDDAGRSLPGSCRASGQPLNKEWDDTLSQTMLGALCTQMDSVGILIAYGNEMGTVFRVGSRYVMTALHVITTFIDPKQNSAFADDRLESAGIFITFNASPIAPSVNQFRLTNNFVSNEELDVVVLELSNLSNLPMKMNLRYDFDELRITDVSLVGYGHSKHIKKCLDPRCQIIHPSSRRIQSAHASLQDKLGYYRSAMQEIGQNPELVNRGYLGYDSPTKMLIDCFMEKGASGAPALTNNNERSVEVVGLLTHGMPEFYFSLPNMVKAQFPNTYRFELCTTMKSIFEWINAKDPDLANDLFNSSRTI